MKYQSILIVTYGRSGSTLLQGVLNSIDGCLIRGENYNFCYGLFKSYQRLLQAKLRLHSNTPQHPWYGAKLLDEEVFLGYAGKMIKDLLLADEKDNQEIICYGFKEIRYTKLSTAELFDYLSFFTKVMPRVAFIFNTRNMKDVVKSGWWVDYDPENTITELERTESNFKTYLQNHDNCFHIDYSDVVAKSDRLVALFEFLGAPYSEDKVNEVLSLPHSYDPNQEEIKSLFEMEFAEI